MSDCECFWVDPKYWFTHYGATEPGSMMEPNPECPEHFPKGALVFSDWADFLPVKETHDTEKRDVPEPRTPPLMRWHPPSL